MVDLFSDLDPDSGSTGTSSVPTPIAAQPDNTAADPFSDLDPDNGPGATSALGAGARAAERGIIPAAGGIAGAGAGAELGATAGGTVGAFFGGVGALPGAAAGAIIGGLAGGFGGSYAADQAQTYAAKAVPDQWKDLLGGDDRQQQLDQTYQPTASFLGGMVPYVLTMHPGFGGAAAALPDNATALQRIGANPVLNRVFSGTLMGGMQLGQEAASGQPIDWNNVAIATGAGLIFNKPNAIGQKLESIGAAGAGRLLGRAPETTAETPTIAQAGDAKVVGPGVTEDVFMGNHQQAPAAEQAAQDAARTESSILGTTPAPVPDVGAVARKMEPELFGQWDALTQQQDDLRAHLASIASPSDEDIGAISAQRDDLQQQLDAHIASRGGYQSGAEARALRAQIRDQQNQIDEMTARRDAFAAGQGADTPEMSSIRQQIQATDLQLRDLAPQVSAANRRAADYAGTETVEPPQATPEITPEITPENNIGPNEPAAPSPAGPVSAEVQQQAAAIASSIARQFVAAGRPADEAEALGRTEAARIVQRSARMNGALGEPLNLYNSEGAQVVRGGARAPVQAPAAPETPAVDPAEAVATAQSTGQAKLIDRLLGLGASNKEIADTIDRKLSEDQIAAYRTAVPAKPPLMPTVEEPTVGNAPEIVAQRQQEPEEPGVVNQEAAPRSAGGIEALDPSTIGVDAKRFQFKAGGDESGVTERLQGVEKWDPRLAGTALVFRDADGKDWIADGHQRLALAQRLSQDQPDIRLNSFVLDAKDGVTDADARAIAAIKNIAEGTGTSIDAAKIIREAKETGIELPPLPPRSTLVKEGRSLASLSPDAFGMVVNDVISSADGAMVGRLVKDPDQQSEAVRLISQAKPENAQQAEMIVRDMLGSGTEMMTKQGGLFGEEAFASSVVLERAKIADQAVKLLRKDKATFGTLVKEAERIQGAGANVLDQQANQSRLSTDEKASDLLTQLAFRAGPVSDALSGIARRLKSGDISPAEGAREFLGAIRSAVEGGVDTGADVGGTVAGAAGEREGLATEPGAEGLPQTLIPGVEPITDAQRAQLEADRGLHGGDAAPGGLFDEDAQNQRTLFQAAPATDTPEFKNWFGDSKVVDRNGEPLVVYHGTSSPQFSRFKTGEDGSFFTENKTVAKEFGYRLEPVYLGLKNPLIEDMRGKTGKAVFDLIDRAKDGGFDGVIARNVSEGDGVPVHDQYVAFDPTQIKSVANRGTFDPNDPRILYSGKRGAVSFKEGARPVLKIFQEANASTGIHELGHIWLEDMLKDAVHPAANDELRADAQTIRKNLGMKDDQAIPAREQHEQFAKWTEQYLREGRAPSSELAGVFAKFKTWLTQIYQTVKSLGLPLNDDMRGVFDRLLTSEPNRTVIASEADHPTTLATTHENDAAQAHPAEAEPVGDRIVAERDAELARQSPEVQNEIAEAIQRHAATVEPAGAAAAEPGSEDVNGAGGQPEVVGGSGGPGAEPAGGSDSGERGAVNEGGGAGVRESANVPSGSGEPGLRQQRPGTTDNAGATGSLSPQPTPTFDNESAYVDKAGNIKRTTLGSTDDVWAAVKASANRNADFIGDRRGVVSDGQVLNLAHQIGMDGAEQIVRDWVRGRALNASEIVALGHLVDSSAMDLNAAAVKAAASQSPEDLVAQSELEARHDLIQAALSGSVAESGRATRAIRLIKQMNGKLSAAEIVAQATGRTLFQKLQEAKAQSAFDDPAQLSKWRRDQQKHSIGRAMFQLLVNNLISNPITHLTYAAGNGALLAEKVLLQTPLSAILGEIRARQGYEGPRVRMGEVPAALSAARRSIPAAIRGVGQALKTGQTPALPGEQSNGFLLPAGPEGARPNVDLNTSWHDVMSDAYGVVRGIPNAFSAYAGLLKAGGLEGAPTVGTKFVGDIPNVQYKGQTVLPLGTASTLPSRQTAAIHTFFRVMNYAVDISQQAYRTAAAEGLTGPDMARRVALLTESPTDDMMRTAGTMSNDLTLMGKSGDFMQRLSKLMNWEVNLPVLGNTQPLRFIDPFLHIAGQMAKQGVQTQTPLAFLSLMNAEKSEMGRDLTGKNGVPAQHMAVAKVVAGTALAAGFMALRGGGNMNGAGPNDPRQAALWRMAGNQPYSIKIGDTWYAMHRLGPLGFLGGLAADMYDAAHSASQGDMQKAGAQFLFSFSQNFLDEGFLSGPSEMFKAIDNPQRNGERYVSNFVGGFVPYSQGMAQMARSLDPYQRDARTFMDQIRAKIPWASEGLPVRRDIFGNPISNMDQLGPTSIYETQVNRDPVIQAMQKLSIFPATPTRDIRGVPLTPEQYDYYSATAGTMAKSRLDVIVSSPDFQTWSPDSQADVIREVFTQSREAARNAALGRWPSIATAAYMAKTAGLKMTGAAQ